MTVAAHRRAGSLLACIVALALFGQSAAAQAAPTSPQRRELRCGIDATEAEYTTAEDHGPRVAFDTALCQAVAVALLGPPPRIRITTYPDDTAALRALRAGEIDLIPTLSADLQHTTDSTVVLTAPVLHDALTLLVPDTATIRTPADAAGKKICFLAETETEVALQDWSRAEHVAYIPFPFQEEGEMEAAFITNNCSAIAADSTRLGGIRASLGTHAAHYHLLLQSLNDDPLALAVRACDPALHRIAQWTVEALLLAEQTGITAANAATFPAGKSGTADRLLGRTREAGAPLGLRDIWAAQTIQTVGNYGELFTRTLGTGSPMGLPRGINALCSAGGAMCPLPLK